MIRTSVRLGVSCALLALAACATAPAKPITPIESTSPKKRIVLIEPYFKLITDKGLFERFHDDWTGSAKLLFAKNLEERLTAKGIELVIPDPAAPADELQPGGELSKLLASRNDAQFLPVPEWTPALAGMLGTHYEADYALFIHIEDSYSGAATVTATVLLLPLALLVCSQGNHCAGRQVPLSACA